MPGLDLSTNDIAMYQLDDNGEKKDDSHIDYKRIDELVEASQKLYPDMDRFVLWVMAADYWIQEEYKQESLEISV